MQLCGFLGYDEAYTTYTAPYTAHHWTGTTSRPRLAYSYHCPGRPYYSAGREDRHPKISVEPYVFVCIPGYCAGCDDGTVENSLGITRMLALRNGEMLISSKNYLPEEWVKKLRDYKQYQGVRYEIAVASLFVRIGCNLDFYKKEKSPKGYFIKRPEFIAELPITGDKVAVEAKSRQRKGVLHQPGEKNLLKAMLGDVTNLFNDALSKEHDNLPYLIFIDINAPIDGQKTVETRWFSDIKKMLDQNTKNLNGKPEPYNGVISTNFSPHYHEDNPSYGGGYAIAMNQHMQNDFVGGPEGVFMSILLNAIHNYGRVPPDMNQ